MQIVRRSVLFGIAVGGCARSAKSGGFAVEQVATGFAFPWSIAFLPGGEMLVSEKMGALRRVLPSGVHIALTGGPQGVLQGGDSGLLDVALSPDFANSAEVFISFVEGSEESNQLALYRARLEGSALRGGEVIWRSPKPKAGAGHPGGRIAFLPDGTLLLTAGEGYDYRAEAQSLVSLLGKVLRLTRDGKPPENNPFAGDASAAPEIFTYGHRNPYGLIVDPRDGAIWQHEMGPRGGDELNCLIPGANYGWPLATYGTDYDGSLISPDQTRDGVTAPVVVWSPSISPSGLALYSGDAFPDWRGDFFIGALSGKHLRRVRMRGGIAQLEEVLLHDRQTRIRDVRAGPDGFIYVATDAQGGEIWRLRPER